MSEDHNDAFLRRLAAAVINRFRGWQALRALHDKPVRVVENPPPTHHVFGACPLCGEGRNILNVGQEHWGVCHAHRFKWFVGMNILSSWHDEDEERWEANRQVLEGYTHVEPAPFDETIPDPEGARDARHENDIPPF